MKAYLLSTFFFLLFIGCGSFNDQSNKEPSFRGAIIDSTSWYLDQSTTVRESNVTFLTPNASLCAPYTDTSAAVRACTLLDVENDTDPYDTYKPSLDVAFTTSTFFLSNEVSNALLFQKGKSTRSTAQKSWKIKLDSKTNLYENQRRLQYNKQFYDMTRLRNKLSFDLFIGIPNFTSLKTEFVQLNIDNVDKGLFTKVESCDKDYLLNRGWSKDENLYKAQNFLFYLKPELTLTDKGVPVDLVAFSSIIEPQRGKKQTKLIEMLNAVNNASISSDTVISKYFNRENYLTWLALNILTGNVDTITQNFFLLNPVNSDTFYFLPWDYDDAWGWYKQEDQNINQYARWHKSISRWWDAPLHNKFLRVKKNRDDLDLKIVSLRADYFTDAQIQAKVDEYKAVAGTFILQSPDVDNLIYQDNNSTLTQQNWEAECDILKTRLQENIDEYNAQKGSPMPFWQVATYSGGTTLTLQWDTAVDFEDDAIVYDILIGSDPDFNVTDVNLTNQVPGTDLGLTSFGEVSYTSDIALTSGNHYMKVLAKESLNAANYRLAFDSYSDANDKIYHGVLEFQVP
ncbi:CotH kinase family protein [Sulfurimonas sp. SAG-AH-194-C20]|nr:CotH kinase family protein [Sulfurimonas sp. SAG-AH-194-C20]MDF1878372.1 CotH kinase family protein [Sulfurimonas sp. SAG-AH-194-C20]